jgi:hypothetical protein
MIRANAIPATATRGGNAPASTAGSIGSTPTDAIDADGDGARTGGEAGVSLDDAVAAMLGLGSGVTSAVGVGPGTGNGAIVALADAGTMVVVKWDQRYARNVRPDPWISAARSRPTYRKCHGSES